MIRHKLMHELQIGPDRVVGRMIDTIDFHAAAKEILIRLHPGLTTPQLPASRLIEHLSNFSLPILPEIKLPFFKKYSFLSLCLIATFDLIK